MSSAPSSPTVHRRQLGAELRRLRKAAGLGIEQVAHELSCSQTRVSRIETGKGRYVAKPDEVETLCRLYGVTDDRQVQMLLDMLTNSQKRGWWESYEDVLPSGLEVYVGLETTARSERGWEPLLVHGLLQTPEYARAVLQATPSNRLHDVEALVALRLERQKLLTRPGEPLEFWAILDEAAVRRPVGGPEVMRAQLNHLVETAALPNVTVQVVPTDKGAHPGLGGAFSLLEFLEDDPVVYVDSPAGNLYLEKKHDVRRFAATFDLLRAFALAPDESTALVRRVAEEIQ
ncbi:helix-turn-helix domain-containing protein [Streptomyces atacamensis]|uniref:helix-turn-helix domain-containing protein n=1 Tax=Streptomyces atacamensis TaxID=531966 RepID=UPI00399CE86B